MKKNAFTVAAFFSLLVLLPLVLAVGANPNPSPGPLSIDVKYLPDYSGNFIILTVNVSVWQDINQCNRKAWYSLDGQKNVSIPLTFKGIISEGNYYYEHSEASGELKMPMWSESPHILNVTVVYDYGDFFSAESKALYIGQPEPTQTPLIVTILSPKDQATYSIEVPLTYSVNTNVWYSYYTLDNSDSTTSDWQRFEGNITLNGLAEGSHKLELFFRTEDTDLGFAERTVYFKVDSSIVQATPTPTTPEFTVLGVVVLMLTVFGVMLIVKKSQTSNRYSCCIF
ncbi:MAG: hypothetical protein ACFCUE_13090 [Candidatus Bathyarchaeia archaeon]|jgi:hypothetical protein